jgi:peptide/nickel transport system permease protein
MNWSRPDGSYLVLFQSSLTRRAPASDDFALSQDIEIKEAIRNWAIKTYNATDSKLIKPEVTLFAKADKSMLDVNAATVLKGEYTVTLSATGVGGDVGFDAKTVIFGTVFGIAGTDDHRRDLLIGLLWGAPIALAFGSVAATVIVLLEIVIGAIASWYGGWLDEFTQRAADLLLILPILPILILIAIIYSPGIWTILGILVLFGVVGSSTKIARSIVLQVKEEPYVEAAISYGASRTRILFRHILPRLLPYTFALIALSVPSFIFLEASLSFLGLGDPLLPTWGSILGNAYNGSAPFRGFWWWIAFPAGGIVFATVAFALLGYSFDKVLNPRLREE